MQIVFGLIVLAGSAAFCAAGFLWSTAYEDARFKFPLTFQDELAGRFAIDHLIWDGAVAPASRRKYLLSMAFFSAAAGCAALGFAIHGPLLGAISFGAVSVIGATGTLTRWMKHRGQI